jgi:hypothetical protein
MKLYHGTNVGFGFINLEKCPPNRDFGQGFYLTNICKHAQERAQDKVDAEGGVVTVMEYDFDLDEIVTTNPNVKIKCFSTVCEEWARFVMFNRLRKENDPAHEYDIVEGPVANDKMFRQFQLFLTNRIKLNEFIKSLTFRETTYQIAFCSEQAIDLLLAYNEPSRYKVESLVSELSVALMKDCNITEIEAMKIVYNSNVFSELSDYTTYLYRKTWVDIYDILQREISKK